MMQGLLTEVIETTRGSQAAATVAAGETVIPVEDVSDFPETGGTVDIAGARYEYVTVTPGDSGLVFGEGTSEPDPANPTETPADSPLPATPASAGTLTLTAPLAAEVTEDDPVQLIIGAEPASDAYAVVDLLAGEGDAPEGGDTVQVPIAYADRAMFLVGPYDPPLAITVDDALTTVLTVPGARPTIDGGAIVNLPDDQLPTEPPVDSPAVEVHGTADALVVEVLGEYAGSTTLEFHISTTPDFTPTAETLSGASRSAVFVMTDIPVSDGAGGTTRERLQPDTTYYVRTVATNVVGAAAPGPVASGVLDPSVVSEIVTARLVAGFVLAGSIQAGNITINPTTGITIPQSNGGVIHFPADGSPADVDAHINARSLNVENDLSINGYGELAGDLQMVRGVSTPTSAPTIATNIPLLSLPTSHSGGGSTGICSATEDTSSDDYLYIMRGLQQVAKVHIGTNDSYTTHTITGMEAGETIVGIDVALGPGGVYKMFASTISATDATVRIRRISLDTWAVEGTRVVNAASNLNDDAYIAGNVVAYTVYNATTGAITGIRAKAYDLTQATMPQIGSEMVITSTAYRVLGAAMTDSTLLLWRNDSTSTIFAWTMAINAGANTATATRATTGDMATPVSLDGTSLLGFCSDKASTAPGDGTYAVVSNDKSRVYHMAPTGAVTLKIGYTWYDSDTNGGTHESDLSPTTTLTIPGGRWPTITFPPAPEVSITDPGRVDKANRIGVYADKSGTMRRQEYLSIGKTGYQGKEVWWYRNPLNGDPPPATNQFLTSASQPGRIRSGATDAALNPLIDLRGDGIWRLGGLAGAASGAVTGQGRVQAGVSTYRATATGGAPGAILGKEATPTVWSNSILRGFTYDSTTGTWTCQAGAGGTYLVFAKASWAADTVNDWGCGVQVWKNDAQMGGIGDITLHSKVLGNSTGPTLVAPIEIAAGDRMQVSIWQNSGTARTPNGMQFYLVPLLG